MDFFTKIKLYTRYLAGNFKTDTVEFKVTSELDYDEVPEGWEWKRTDIIINNKPLFERLREYELAEARRTKTSPELAGKYLGIDPQDLFKTLNGGNNSELAVWQCSICRSSLCSSDLVCKYKVGPFYVEFYDFRQKPNPIPFNNSEEPHHETIEKYKWNYEAFGPFRFNRKAFFKSLASVKGS